MPGKNYKIAIRVKGMTLTEILVSMALASLTLTVGYRALAYVQQLFYMHKDQSRFVNEYTFFKKSMDTEFENADMVVYEAEHLAFVKADSIRSELYFQKEMIWLKKEDHCDTFHFAATRLEKELLALQNNRWRDRILSRLSFTTQYKQQEYCFIAEKRYDAQRKLKLETDTKHGYHQP